MRILIVEDDPRIARFLEKGLIAESHFCVVAEDGKTGLALALEGDFDLVLLDLVLPEMHGHEVCQELRMKKKGIPVIILTGMDSLNNIVEGLRMGADDYITKPFAYEELLARIATVMRRNSEVTQEDPTLKAGDLEFNRKTLKFSVAGKSVKMTVKELAIIELLMSHPGVVFSRERILGNVWGLDRDPMTNIVDVYIGRLRKKIEKDPEQPVIETLRGVGYRLNTD
jgi:DNA-binding response OmpR family regulator